MCSTLDVFQVCGVARRIQSSENGCMPSTSSLRTCLSYNVNDLTEQERGKTDILCMIFSVRGWEGFPQLSLSLSPR